MAYEYQYESGIKNIIHRHNLWVSDTDYKNAKESLSEVYRKAKAWDALKEILMREYPQLIRMWESTHGEGEHAEYCKANEILERMDKLDNTNEFSNLLSDLEDE